MPEPSPSRTGTGCRDRGGRFDPPYDRLQLLPRGLWMPVLVTSVGDRSARLDHARHWLDALLAGELPAADADFGDLEATRALRAELAALRLHEASRALPALAEQVLRTTLWHLDRLVDLQPALTRSAAIEHAAAAFRDEWEHDRAGWADDLALLRTLARDSRMRWDELRGQLRSREWQLARQAARRLAALPEISALLQRLGRREPAERPRPTPVPDDGMRRPLPLRRIETHLPDAPGERIGVRLGASPERMLPSEAMLRGHPRGRRLWRARRAEGRMLEHETQAIVPDLRPDADARVEHGAAPPHPTAAQRGPIVLCLDTSGSMAGAPGHIAQAVAMAALQAAHEQGRGCRLVAFGGHGECVHADLAGPDGLQAVMALMGQAFEGGTDLQTPIEHAVALVQASAWHGADLLLVSDGEFGCTPASLERLDAARRDHGLFVQGVLVGDRETLGLLEVCDAIHWIRDWRRHADGPLAQAPSPVHSRSLTALYFPGALSPRARRHRQDDTHGLRD